MRYYLDTNILVFLKQEQFDELHPSVRSIVEDYGNTFYTSSVCVHEFIQLCQIGKVGNNKRTEYSAEDIIPWLESSDIEIIYTTRQHLKTMAAMPARHSDPYDRLIIAQAICDRIPVISSDDKFKNYERYGLEFIYNKR